MISFLGQSTQDSLQFFPILSAFRGAQRARGAVVVQLYGDGSAGFFLGGAPVHGVQALLRSFLHFFAVLTKRKK